MIGPFADNDLLSLARFLAINLDGILMRAKEVSQVVPDLLGGDLKIRWDRKENLVYMTGPATVVFDGEITLPEGIL